MPYRAAGKTAVIRPRTNRSSPRDYDREIYAARHLIETFFAKIKQFRAIATRLREDRPELPGCRPPRRQRRLAQLICAGGANGYDPYFGRQLIGSHAGSGLASTEVVEIRSDAR
jgi:hypothetical protein